MNLRNLILVVMFISSLSMLIAQPQSTQNSSVLISEQIDGLINPYVATNNYSGSVAVYKDGKMLLSKAYGKMNRSYDLDNHVDSKFFLASVSMIFTSAAIMKLVDEGKIKLDDPLSKYLPDYKHGSRITIHDMLAQRSGIPRPGNGGNIVYNDITRFAHSTEELIEYFDDYDLLFEPGTEYKHERSDYIMLAKIIEKTSGLSFGEYLRTKIFDPLEMTHTGHFEDETVLVKNLCKGYDIQGVYGVQNAPFLDWSSKTGHASIFSTSEDLVKFARAYLDRDLLSSRSWSQIFTNHGDDVGYGWFIRPQYDYTCYQMNGRSPGFSSFLGIYPESDLIVVMLSNMYIGLPRTIGEHIAGIVLEEEFSPLILSSKKFEEEEVADIVGTYQFGPDFYNPNGKVNIRLENGEIVGNWGGLIPVENESGQFRKFIYRRFWSDIEFLENYQGQVVKMSFDEFIGEKVE